MRKMIKKLKIHQNIELVCGQANSFFKNLDPRMGRTTKVRAKDLLLEYKNILLLQTVKIIAVLLKSPIYELQQQMY